MKTLGTAMLVATLAIVAVSPANAIVLTGGNGKPDCYNGLDVSTANPSNGKPPDNFKRVTVKTCAGSCTFTVKSCVGLSEPATCTATALSSLVPTTKAPEGPPANPATLGPENACGEEKTYTITPTKKKAKIKIKLIGTATSAKPKKDRDVIQLACVKTATEDPGCGGGTTTTTTLPPDTCQGNPDGGPDQVVLTVGPSGSDLDNGWTGSSHNFIVVPNGKIGLCVTGGCNDAGQTTCNVTGPVGPGTISGETFGAPLPLFASNVPVCVISKWNGPLSGTIDQATGETTLNVHLFSQVYLTSRDDVCPQCKNGKCNAAAGSNAGKNCTVDATVPVYVSSTQTDNYDLSTTCVYSSPPTATLGIDFVPLTSGTSGTLTGPTPCTKKPGEPAGVPPLPDQCNATGCGSPCTGLACVSQIDDPTNPGTNICVDSKGGLSQLCCNNNTTKPCFTLRNGGTVTRTGIIEPPQPPLPDTTYPKTQDGILVSTFCIPATGTNTIDSVTGLPGPGAIQLPGQAVWTKQ
jgi:hypothetical protein